MRRCIFSSTAVFLQAFPADWSSRRRGRRGRGPSHRTRDGGNAQEDTGGEDKCWKRVVGEVKFESSFQDSKNVVGLVVVNGEGLPVTSSLDSTLTVQVRNRWIRKKIPKKPKLFFTQYSDLITSLVGTARSVVRALDPTNALEYFRCKITSLLFIFVLCYSAFFHLPRVRSRKHEILIAPDRDYTLFIIQSPSGGGSDQRGGGADFGGGGGGNGS